MIEKVTHQVYVRHGAYHTQGLLRTSSMPEVVNLAEKIGTFMQATDGLLENSVVLSALSAQSLQTAHIFAEVLGLRTRTTSILGDVHGKSNAMPDLIDELHQIANGYFGIIAVSHQGILNQLLSTKVPKSSARVFANYASACGFDGAGNFVQF